MTSNFYVLVAGTEKKNGKKIIQLKRLLIGNRGLFD